ncbi:PAN/Apple domain [Dillenia turbinata]|uniref:non-specific serine/threonine protein kinase n=1 Tax=Dillenia turbinata TaxID=194707 RepID=A0AAN8UPA0_9MAGN
MGYMGFHSISRIFVLVSCIKISFSIDTLYPNQFLRDGDVLLSKNETFALGFFTPNNSSSRRYVGVWYNKLIEKNIVWVANRENPINNTAGVLSIDRQGNLLLCDVSRSTLVWSANVSSKSSHIQLLDSGNLVLVEENSTLYVWQSFDHPTDTLLSGMKIGLDRKTGQYRFLTSWRSSDDPGQGDYKLQLDLSGLPQFFLCKGSTRLWRTSPCPWPSPILFLQGNTVRWFSFFTNNQDGVLYSFNLDDSSVDMRFVIDDSGYASWCMWNERVNRWNSIFSFPKEICDEYKHCGAYSICTPSAGIIMFECSCLPGFEPKSPRDWQLSDGSGGCVRKQIISLCRNGEGFLKVSQVKFPDPSLACATKFVSSLECQQQCLRNCSCTAYATALGDEKENVCLMWFGELMDMRPAPKLGMDLFVRVDSITLDSDPVMRKKRRPFEQQVAFYDDGGRILLKSSIRSSWKQQSLVWSAVEMVGAENAKKKRSFIAKNKRVVIPISSAAVVFTLVVIVVSLRIIKRRHLKGEAKQNLQGLFHRVTNSTSRLYKDLLVVHGQKVGSSSPNLALHDFSTIVAATNNFASENMLGRGGFGSVYKGQLTNGVEIAIKRLSKGSAQGVEEFKNEVMLIAQLQHKNLVKLLGCCTQQEEKILVYEYLPNKSLDNFIFDQQRKSHVDWRKRFKIIIGIARGMMYLHKDSRLKIIHRDLKASNVLLDDTMNPKISDFGMARIFEGNQSQAMTKRVVEYVIFGKFSTKSDTFSFGVLLLEIISSKRNNVDYKEHPSLNLIGHVWDLWKEDKALEIVDCSMAEPLFWLEAFKCIQVGLLCVQELETDRPAMSDVVLMLESNTNQLPSPKQPGFLLARTGMVICPEYVIFGKFSTKSDIFSFGVLLLEIISGERNNIDHQEHPSMNLIRHVWDLWREDKALKIVDCSMFWREAFKCIQVGLLCVQEFATGRPSISDVVWMLRSSTKQ